eukprot:2243604-Rhodomonas_salina.2
MGMFISTFRARRCGKVFQNEASKYTPACLFHPPSSRPAPPFSLPPTSCVLFQVPPTQSSNPHLPHAPLCQYQHVPPALRHEHRTSRLPSHNQTRTPKSESSCFKHRSIAYPRPLSSVRRFSETLISPSSLG